MEDKLNIEIKGFVDVSLVDWDGKVSSVIFLPKCNMRCPFCQNASLVVSPEKVPTIPLDKVKEKLARLKRWIDGVVITGGEPTLHKDLAKLCSFFKKEGFKVKIDTNGTHPDVLRKLIDQNLVDYIAMDIKAPLKPEKYSLATGISSENFLKKILETIQILLFGKIPYEFRTTVVPTIHTAEDIEEICKTIRGCEKYAIQNFRPIITIDPRYEKVKPYSNKELKLFEQIARKYISKVIVRP